MSDSTDPDVSAGEGIPDAGLLDPEPQAADGGWFRNVVFVPSGNDEGPSEPGSPRAPLDQVAPCGPTGRRPHPSGSPKAQVTTATEPPFDFAVLHVRPATGITSLEETIGTAAPVRFDLPAADALTTTSVWGYPAGEPFDPGAVHRVAVDTPLQQT